MNLQQKLQALEFKQRNIDLNDKDLKDLESKMNDEMNKLLKRKTELIDKEH